MNPDVGGRWQRHRTEKPEMTPGQLIDIGMTRAVVSLVYSDPHAARADGEVVYIDERNRAINQDVIYNGERWEFANNDGSGGYADRYDRLQSFVALIRDATRSPLLPRRRAEGGQTCRRTAIGARSGRSRR